MGTEISSVAEIVGGHGPKPFVIDPVIHRNYELFGWLAGVRGQHNPICEPRGMPPDATRQTKKLLDEAHFYHSHSWFSFSELNREWERIPAIPEDGPGQFVFHVHPVKGTKERISYRVPDFWQFFQVIEKIEFLAGAQAKDLRLVFAFFD